MSLLEDLQSLDVSGIVNARASISVSISTGDLEAMVSDGAMVTALGGFGVSLQQLRERLDDPSAFVQPLIDAVMPLLERLQPDLQSFERYRTAVQEGARLISDVLGSLDADPALFGQAFGRSLGDVFGTAAELAGNYLPVDLGDFDRLRTLFERVDGNVPIEPRLFAELVLDALAPFPRGNLAQLRADLQRLFDLAGSVEFDVSLTDPLVAAFDAVASATTETQLQTALSNLETAQAQVIGAIQAQYASVATAVGALRLDGALDALRSVSGALRSTEQDILQYLQSWRGEIQRALARARGTVTDADIQQLIVSVTQMLDQFEAMARQQASLVFDMAVERLKEWVRGLVGHLRLRAIRNEIRSFIMGIAQAIRDLGLDVAANEARDLLVSIQTAIGSADLGESVRAALQDIEQQVNDALGGVIAALETIGTEINALAGQAQGVLEQAASVLTGFKATVDGIKVAVENLGIEQAAQQVIDNLVDVRETAEQLLSVAPLPEPLREQVKQLIELVRGIDIDAVFAPVHEAVAQFDIPDAVVTGVTASLESLQEVVQNLIPAELIESIEAEVNQVLDVIRGFDPAGLLSGVTDFVDETAGFIDGISVAEAVQGIAGPFQQVLDKLDELHPERLLAPVIQAYDSLVGQIPSPSPSTVVDRTVGTVGAAADVVTRTATQPARSFLPQGAQGATGEGPQEGPQIQEQALPGDIVRLLGYVPNKLREALAGLEAGPAGEVLAAIDGFTSGLARDMRRVRAEVGAIEGRLEDGLDELLAPLAVAQSRAQLSVRANFSGGGVDLAGAMTVTANAGPGALRAALAGSAQSARAEAHGAAVALGGSIGLALESAADLLEHSSLGRIAGDLDAFLAALDPEPIAQELDELMVAILAKVPEVIDDIRDVFVSAMERIASLMEELNPGVQAHRFLEALNVLQEELDLLNPRHLASDLGEVHAAIRDTIAAYDPRLFAAEVDAILDQIAASLRGLSPEALLGDISFLQDTVNLVENAVPTQALAGIGESLAEIGATLGELDISALLESIEQLGPRVVESFEAVVKAIRNEVLALLESLRYASGSVSVSVQAEVNV